MVKEVSSYEKEVVSNEAKIQKMKDEGKDPYGEHATTSPVILLFSPTLTDASLVLCRHQKARRGLAGELYDDP